VYITAAITGGIAAGVALVVFAVLAFLLRLPLEQSALFSLISFGIGCLVAGYFAGAAKRQGGLATGVKAAILFATPVALIGLVLSGFSGLDAASAVAEADVPDAGDALATITRMLNKTVVAVLCGAIGGVLGVNKNGGFR
jgi:hypothetical protein